MHTFTVRFVSPKLCAFAEFTVQHCDNLSHAVGVARGFLANGSTQWDLFSVAENFPEIEAYRPGE